jgi:tRNA nucleotidyltransferase (CCA-adding enzyme)
MPAPSSTRARWETFEHGADVGVRGFGATREEAFEQAATALTAVVTDPRKVRLERAVQLAAAGPDDGVRLVAWLNALVARMAVERMLFSRFRVRFEGDRVVGTAWGEPVNVARHAPAVEVKGATFTALAVERDPDGGWRAQCVVDV